ncbi:glycosyltransferase family 39 protein [Streptomyces sp. NPDC092296]|uniref:glycosyltransferase family 39 protein n=1 Tax=Streptomyces sp. NPDC092296 TaxID=3366012 RepID=UPI00381ACA2D
MTSHAVLGRPVGEAVGSGDGGRGRGRAWAVVAVVVAVMLAAGFWGLDRGSMWRDESATYDVAHRSVRQILAMVRHVDAVHAVYYLFMHLWLLPGGGEVWMRVPSVLGMAAAAGLVAALGARLWRPRVGLVAGLLFAATPLVTFYAQEGRSYAMVCAGVLLATYCLVRAVETGGRWWAGYAVAVPAAALLHEFAVLVLLAHGAALLLARTPRAVWRRWGIAAAVSGVLLAPLALYSKQQSGQVGWLQRPDWAAVWQLVRLFAGPVTGVVVGVLVLAVVGLVPGPGRPERGRLTVAAVAGPLAVLPPAALLLASQQQPMYHERYVLYALAGLPLLAAAGLERIAALLPGRWPAALLAGLAVAGAVLPQLPEQRAARTLESRPDDLAGAARAVRAGAQPGDGVVFLARNYRAAWLAYPGDFRGLDDVTLAVGPLWSAGLRGEERSPRRTRQAILAKSRIWLVGRAGLSPRGAPAAIDRLAVLDEHFRVAETVHLHGLEVRLYLRR